jgi:ribonuclease P protein component
VSATWRITDRGTFDTLRRSGRRARSGAISVVYVRDGCERARVGYAIGRRVGGSVQRNRLRRCLREAVRALDRQGGLGAGAYLVDPTRDALRLTYEEMSRSLKEAILRAQVLAEGQVEDAQ